MGQGLGWVTVAPMVRADGARLELLISAGGRVRVEVRVKAMVRVRVGVRV